MEEEWREMEGEGKLFVGGWYLLSLGPRFTRYSLHSGLASLDTRFARYSLTLDTR